MSGKSPCIFVIACGLTTVAETNLQAKSLKNYIQTFSPEVAIRTSMAHCKRDPGLWNIPLYAIGAWRDWVEENANHHADL